MPSNKNKPNQTKLSLSPPLSLSLHFWGSLSVIMTNVLDSDIVVCEFEFQLRYYVHF